MDPSEAIRKAERKQAYVFFARRLWVADVYEELIVEAHRPGAVEEKRRADAAGSTPADRRRQAFRSSPVLSLIFLISR
jgi:hypothetical protein